MLDSCFSHHPCKFQYLFVFYDLEPTANGREIGALLYDHVIALKFNSSVSFIRTGSVLPQCCWMRILQLTQLFCESVKKAVGERIVPTIDHQKPNHTKAQWMRLKTKMLTKSSGTETNRDCYYDCWPNLFASGAVSEGCAKGFVILDFDNRNSSAFTHVRTDGGRREDDWTCPSCGNVNFSFCTTCNMRNFTQPRPADHNSKSAPRQMPAPQGYSSSSSYAGSGAISSMYMGVTPYAAFYLQWNICLLMMVLLIVTTTIAVCLEGTLIVLCNCLPHLLILFMIRFSLLHLLLTDGTRENDWECPKCGNVNMRKCNTPKPGSQVAKPAKSSKVDMPEGSWKCDKCNK
ncbi:Zinc finger, RanBP2-type [Artemisia annua]|uniref:Zinc finger, RanBP2-type n=1 Tax=Artemisia annua TaxID=35608 RepID=A0A2U1LF30_ARTAN|nr:Zinc finger, RanBP2-type [Artemisia annua]